jgi:hypothetical protein
MRQLLAIYLFISILSAMMAAQIMPKSTGSCGVSASGLESCDWISAINIRKAPTSRMGEKSELAHNSDGALFVTTFLLAHGAPLDSRQIVGGEVLIVARNSGEVVDEKKSPPTHINVFENLVMLMPKHEPYLLRNNGKNNLELMLIEIRKETPKATTSRQPR